MDISTILRKRIAPELNHLYTEPPFTGADGGRDCGWYCREVALHVFFVSLLLGVDADLRLGDFHATFAPNSGISSVGDDADHAWGRVGTMLPVDLSMTFRHFHGAPQLRMPICKTGTNGDYQIHYTTNALRSLNSPARSVFLIEREIVTPNVSDLISNPYLFIHPPDPTNPHSWHNIYGPGIYAAVSLHCFRAATGHSKMTRNRLSQSGSSQWIHESYPNAQDELHRLLQ
jgi:hypothetical protein